MRYRKVFVVSYKCKHGHWHFYKVKGDLWKEIDKLDAKQVGTTIGITSFEESY